MMYEVKVNELAEEFGVHRNTIRNWINSGLLPAEEGPGRRYLIHWQDYKRLCDKFGREPKPAPESPRGPEEPSAIFHASSASVQAVELGAKQHPLYTAPSMADICLTCGSCAGACPLSGVDELDPRKVVRMAFLGLEDELIQSDWPWKCSMCGKCENACPMNVEILKLMRRIRGRRRRDQVPHPIQRGVQTCLEKGNNLGIPKDDFIALLKTMGSELAASSCPGFITPIDQRGARLLVTVNSKEPFAEPDNLTWWWRIFHAAGESWTIPTEHWEGVNWAFYSGDNNSMRVLAKRLIDNVERLNCQALLLPECGHAYLATRFALKQWYPDALQQFRIYSVFDLLLEYLQQGRIRLNPDYYPHPVAFHDGCNYGRKSLKVFGHGYFDEARRIASACCAQLVEFSPFKAENYCCGAGGGAWASPFAAERVFHGRMKARQIKESGAKMVLTSCHNCKDQIEKSLNREFNLGVEVQYIWQLVASALMPGQEKAP